MEGVASTTNKINGLIEECFIRITADYAKNYFEKPQHVRKVLTTYSVPVKIIAQAYLYCVRGGLTRIEDLEQPEKESLFNEAKMWFKEFSEPYSKEKIINLCKAIYILKNI